MEAQVAPSQDQWMDAAAKGTTVTTEQLDGMVNDMRAKREVYEAAKEKASELYKTFDEAERLLIAALQSAGKRKYHVDGVGLVFFVEKLVVPTPKTVEQKDLFFAWIEKEYGVTYLKEKLSVHHQVLQSLYNNAFKEAQEKGDAENFQVPGLEQPTTQISLNFRKETK